MQQQAPAPQAPSPSRFANLLRFGRKQQQPQQPLQQLPADNMQVALQSGPPAIRPGAPPIETGDPITITRIFKWQEKVYSRAEAMALSAAAAAGGDPAAAQAAGTGSVLFTYVQGDPFIEQVRHTHIQLT